MAALALSALLPLTAQGSTKSGAPPQLPPPPPGSYLNGEVFGVGDRLFGDGDRLLNITASSLYDAGLQQGTLARSRIQEGHDRGLWLCL